MNVGLIQVPNTTGFVRSFSHMRLRIAGLEFTGGFKSFKRSRTRERELPYSNGPNPIGKTIGENKFQASGVLYYDWMMYIINTLGPGYGDQPFTIYSSYGGLNLNAFTDELLGCTFDSTEADDSAGTPALTREIQFNPVLIKFGGIDDVQYPPP